MAIKTTRIKSTQAPQMETLCLTPQLNGSRQTFSLPRQVKTYDRHYLIWNSTVYRNDGDHHYYSISADGMFLTTYFDQAPQGGAGRTLQLVVDMAGDGSDETVTKSDLSRTENELRSEITSEANTRANEDRRLQGEIDKEVSARQQLASELNSEISARKAADDALGSRIDDETAARQEEDVKLQAQIDAISSASDVVDVINSHKDLDQYDKRSLKDNDIIKVLRDEEHNEATTYYRYNKGSNIFDFIGQVGPYYTSSEMDSKLNDKQDTLKSGENLKTINGQSILGEGDLEISAVVEELSVEDFKRIWEES